MHFRYARHTAHLQPLIDFYCGILQLDQLGNFTDHTGYNGVFIGKKDENWHLEFTVSTHIPEHTSDEDDLVVFYPETTQEYELIVEKYTISGKIIHNPTNPYWKENGIFMKDPDGFGVIISRQKITE
jgi:hypothetical protein